MSKCKIKRIGNEGGTLNSNAKTFVNIQIQNNLPFWENIMWKRLD